LEGTPGGRKDARAIRKMTHLPAQVLEARVPAMRRKGRLVRGADADVVVFDPATVIDQADYTHPARPSVGMRHVLVHGEFVVRDGALIESARPGRAGRVTADPEVGKRNRPTIRWWGITGRAPFVVRQSGRACAGPGRNQAGERRGPFPSLSRGTSPPWT
jgi:hypothetical protein